MKISQSLSVVASVIILGLGGTASATTYGPYAFVSLARKCMDAYNFVTDGTPVQQRTCNATANQKYELVSTGGWDPSNGLLTYHIRSVVNRQKCVAVEGTSTGYPAILTYCRNETAQYFSVVYPTPQSTSFRLQVQQTGMCLQVNGAVSTDGAAITQWPFNGASHFYWTASPF